MSWWPEYTFRIAGHYKRWVNSPHKGTVSQSFDIFFLFSPNKLVNKQPRFWRFQTPQRSCDVTIITIVVYVSAAKNKSLKLQIIDPLRGVGWHTYNMCITWLAVILQHIVTVFLIPVRHDYFQITTKHFRNLLVPDNHKVYQYISLSIDFRGPLYQHGLTLIPAWISTHMPSEVWDEMTYPFPDLNGCTVEVWEMIIHFIPYFMMDVIIYPWWD